MSPLNDRADIYAKWDLKKALAGKFGSEFTLSIQYGLKIVTAIEDSNRAGGRWSEFLASGPDGLRKFPFIEQGPLPPSIIRPNRKKTRDLIR